MTLSADMRTPMQWDALHDRIAELEAENARLRAMVGEEAGKMAESANQLAALAIATARREALEEAIPALADALAFLWRIGGDDVSAIRDGMKPLNSCEVATALAGALGITFDKTLEVDMENPNAVADTIRELARDE